MPEHSTAKTNYTAYPKSSATAAALTDRLTIFASAAWKDATEIEALRDVVDLLIAETQEGIDKV